MARERGSRESEPFPEPDMLPLMNIILMLILALITMAALLPLGLLSSEAQKLSRGGAPASDFVDKSPLNLIVFITEEGFNFSTYGEAKMGAADPKNVKHRAALIPRVVQSDGSLAFDYAALQAKLEEFKKADSAKFSRDEQSMTITADPEIKFDVIIQSMDAARYQSSEKKPLFPKVSFAAGMVAG